MSSSPSTASSNLTGLRKAAIALVSFDREASAAILRQLPEEEVGRLATEIMELDSVPTEQIEAVLEQCQKAATGSVIRARGGQDFARIVLSEAFGVERASRLMDRVTNSGDPQSANVASLRKLDPQQLATFIHEEHPQTIALVLSHMDPSKAAAVLGALPEEIRSDVAIRMAGMDEVAPESVRAVAAVIGQKMSKLGQVSRGGGGGVKAVANVFNRLDPAACSQLLEAVEKADPQVSDNIRRLMFVFEDLLSLDEMAIREVLAKVDKKLLMLALKGAGEKLRQHFMGGMSQHGAEMFLEDMVALGPVKLKEVDKAQQEIISLVRQMEQEGTISLQSSSADQYVT